MRNYKGWSEDRIELLKTLWAEGWSASRIANRLGGTTRSAVIGKVHRLQLPGRDPKVETRRTIRAARNKSPWHRPKAPKPRRTFSTAPIPLAQDFDVARKNLIDLENDECRWPVGDVGDETFGFCALKAVEGSSYCATHTIRASAGLRIETPRTAATVEASSTQSGKQMEVETTD